MTRRLPLLAALLTLSLGSLAQEAAPSAAPAPAGVAVVNGVTIPAVYANFERQARINRNLPAETLTDEAIRDTLINIEILAQEAMKKNLDKAPSFVAMLAFRRMDLLSQATLDDFMRSNPVPENVLKENYERAKANTGGTEYRTRHILVSNEKLALELLETLKKKKVKFEDLAKKHSKDNNAASGGDLGWNIPANYVKEFGEAMAKMKKGEISAAPVKTNFGWHILKMEDVRKINFPPYEKLKGRIAREIQQQALTKYVDQLRAAAKIQ